MAAEPTPLDQQRRFNKRTEPLWDGYTSHRQQVMTLLLAQSNSSARLCVLGAGNCNDLDLPALLAAYGEITLVDWDDAALRGGVARQLPTPNACCKLLGGVEVTGAMTLLADQTTQDATVEQVLKGECRPDLNSLGTFGVVASTCLLSQLTDCAAQAMGRHDPRLPALAIAFRRQHLQLMLELLQPGGMGLLITDIVSSDTAAALLTAEGTDLRLLARQLLQAGNFFAGLHPGQILADLSTPGLFPVLPTGANISAPWLWQVGPRRFLVLTATFRRGLVAG